ncbi:uncharacterized protein LOC123295029 [Chrysoperla carnea]|uniref:uncharacterized protein LOC123295029 n=1 Tax=Chrysoperla carnea TaxID=189513 RepID=UPI001D092839|nr:uncharacterized protein LOC123295029 [Chrysoperla carnea]
MEILWNLKDLLPPPTNTSKVKIQGTDVLNLHKIIKKFFREFENTQCINQEAAMLSRIIYRMKYKFRSDKGFKNMEKVNRALLQYLNMNYVQYIQTFLNTIDLEDINNVDIYLPTKQMLEYLLVRTQGFAKLMQRIIESCEITAQYMSSRISIGQSWNLGLLVVSNCSRIHFISNYLLQKSCEFYNGIVPYLDILQLSGVKWLADDYNFPSDLYLWLNISNENPQEFPQITNETGFEIETNCNSNTNIDFGVKIDRESLNTQEGKASKKQRKNKNVQNLQSKENSQNNKTSQTKDNTGFEAETNRNIAVKIKRESSLIPQDKTSTKRKKIKGIQNLQPNDNVHNISSEGKVLETKKNQSEHKVDSITDFESLRSFMRKEDKYRKSANKKSLTKHVDLLQWKLLQKVVCKFMKKMVKAQDNKKTTTKLIGKIKKILKNNIVN